MKIQPHYSQDYERTSGIYSDEDSDFVLMNQYVLDQKPLSLQFMPVSCSIFLQLVLNK